MKLWEFENTQAMYSLLVGKQYGDDTELRLRELRADKKRLAGWICQAAIIEGQTQAVLEIGPGSGHITKFIAPQTKHLYCADISQSFLEVAQKECFGIDNVSFHKIDYAKFDFLADRAIDIVYANNVFIHFNLFDFHWYFKEISRVLKVGGRVWFDFASTNQLAQKPTELFLEMADLFKKQPEGVGRLVQWNAPQSIINLAEQNGFKVLTQRDSLIVLELAAQGS